MSFESPVIHLQKMCLGMSVIRMYVEPIDEQTQSHRSLAYEYHGNTFYTFPVFTATAILLVQSGQCSKEKYMQLYHSSTIHMG